MINIRQASHRLGFRRVLALILSGRHIERNYATQQAVHVRRVIRTVRQGLIRGVDSVMSTLRR